MFVGAFIISTGIATDCGTGRWFPESPRIVRNSRYPRVARNLNSYPSFLSLKLRLRLAAETKISGASNSPVSPMVTTLAPD
jgi:hypothetical protein